LYKTSYKTIIKHNSLKYDVHISKGSYFSCDGPSVKENEEECIYVRCAET